MKKAVLLFLLLVAIANQSKSQSTYTETVCEDKSFAVEGYNRNQWSYEQSPPALNTGYQHNISVPTWTPPPNSCGVEVTGLNVEITVSGLTDLTSGDSCNLGGWYTDILIDCPDICWINQSINGGCNLWDPAITSQGIYSLELMDCPSNPSPTPSSVVMIDVMPAMDYGDPDPYDWCPYIDHVIPSNGLATYADIDYTLCIDFELTATPMPTAAIYGTENFCVGEDIELEAEGGLDYQWSGPLGFSSTDQYPIIPNATGLNAGTYFVTVSTGPGCEDYASITVDVTEIIVSVDDIGGPTCFQGFNGFADLSASGGNGPYDYDWFPGGYTTSFVDELAAGITYEVFVFDGDGCEGYIEIEVFDPPEVIVTLDNSQDPSCATATDGQATFSATGGDNPYDIIWSPGGFNTFSVNTLGAGTYDVTVTDFHDCEAYGTVTLTPAQSATIAFTPVMPFCPENTTETLMATPMGGTWSGAVNASGSFNPSTLSAGSYDAIYTYVYGGNCEAKDTLEITILPITTITFGNSVFCRNLTTATLSAMPMGGTWSGAGITATGEINPSMLSAGMHTFSYAYTEQNNNCTTTQDFTITIEEPPTVVINGDNDFCQTAGMQTYTATPMNGTWGGVANMSGQVDASTLAVGMHDITYTVTVGNCTATSTYPITVSAPPSGTISGGGNLCSGGTSNLDLNLTGTGPWMVTLALGGVAQVPFSVMTSPHQQSVNQPGTYTIVSVTDASGCVGMGTGSATVNEIAPLMVTNVQTQCDATNTNFVLTFDITGGDPTSYQVTGVMGTIAGTTFTSQSIPQGTTINFTVSDNTNCGTVSDNVTVNCACSTMVGTMDLTQLEICGTGTAMANYDNANENLDGNDALQFVLHDAAGVSLGNILGMNTTPSFAFGGTMIYGTTYYISAIAGNNDGSGSVDQSDNCLQVAQGTPVVFYEIPTATLSGGNPICEGESATLTFTLTGNSPWSVQYSDGTNSFDLNGITTSPFMVTVMPTATTTYSATSTSNGNCIGTASGTATITVNTPPSADVTSNSAVCNSTQSGEPTTFDFSTLVTNGDRNGTWMDVDGSGATGTFPSLDFNGITPGDYTFRYTTNSAVAPCSEATYDITITVRDCNCPSVQTASTGPFCIDNAMVTLSDITITTENGIWDIIDRPTGSSASITNGIFNAAGTAGNYELEFRLTTTVAGCPEFSTQTIVVNEPPTAQVMDNASVCNSSQSGQSTTFDFSTLVTAGDMGGSWTDVDGSGATGAFPNLDFENIPIGDYTFRYNTNSAMMPCSEATYDVTLTVRDCNCPSVETTGAGPFCNDNARIQLNDLTITTESGDWRLTSQPAGGTATIGNNILSATGEPEGNYELEFRLSNPVNGCPETSTQTIQLFAPPSAEVTNAASVCNSSQSGDLTTFDFTSLVTGGDRDGNWIDVDGSGATGSFPSLDFENITPGNYNFRYTTNSATAPCSEAVYDVTITVQDCNCPSVETTGAGPLCNDNAIVDLTDLTITTEDGNWSITDQPAGAMLMITNGTFDATGAPEGDYELEFRLANPIAGCPPTSTQTIQVFAAPTADVNSVGEVCNSSQNGEPTTLDFSTLINSGDRNGTWTDVDGSGATGAFPTLDFENITPGNYTFRYTTGSASAPCTEASYDVVLTVRDCSCPSVLTTGAGPICNDAMVDLTDLTLTTENGSWSILSEPNGSTAMINGNSFDANGSPSGAYELEFRLTTAVAGCPEFSTQTIMIDAAPNAGDVISNLEICEGLDTIISLLDLIENYDAGSWSDISLNPIATGFDASSGILSSSGIAVGNYNFSHIVLGMGACADASTEVEIIINESPTADAGMDVEIDCENTAVNLGGSSTGGLGVSYNWSGDVDNPNARTTMTSQPGTYVITVRNTATGCSDSDEVEVTVSNDFPLLDPSHTDVSCPDLADGIIEVGNISGGQSPYVFSLNGSAFTDQTTYTDLPAGTYILKVEDAVGCVDSISIEVFESAPINADLSASRTLIQVGESTTLTASTTAMIDSILWFPANEFDNCFDCLTQMVSPETQTTYSIRVVDENGCDAIASVTINLEEIIEDGVFIPSAFSPNNDGINDIFLPFAGSKIAKINYFYVYDRWGEPVHKVTDMEPNDQSAGWDGTFKGRVLNTAVFAWAAEVEYTDGTSRVFEGDVSLFR